MVSLKELDTCMQITGQKIEDKGYLLYALEMGAGTLMFQATYWASACTSWCPFQLNNY